MITARIVLDSINPAGKRLTTWLLTYPRFIHSEMMTHRVFSRNSASSRAIPLNVMIEAILNCPAQPQLWARNQKGMQGNTVVANPERARELWLQGSHLNIGLAKQMSQECNLHKAIANRILEPWTHMTVLATATDHRNFFALRAHPAAQPEFQVLAYKMLALYLESTPQELAWGEWHLPGLDETSAEALDTEDKLKICTALACRASYTAFDDVLDHADAFRIHDTAKNNGHLSPFEHCAQASKYNSYPWSNFDNPQNIDIDPGNEGLSHWMQYRKIILGENKTDVNLQQILDNRPEWVL